MVKKIFEYYTDFYLKIFIAGKPLKDEEVLKNVSSSETFKLYLNSVLRMNICGKIRHYAKSPNVKTLISTVTIRYYFERMLTQCVKHLSSPSSLLPTHTPSANAPGSFRFDTFPADFQSYP